MRDSKITVITPVYKETAEEIVSLLAGITLARQNLAPKGQMSHYFLDDGSRVTEAGLPLNTLVRHTQNKGLAQTLIEGYEAIWNMRSLPDVAVQLYSKHDAGQIPDVVSRILAGFKFVFLPVWYEVPGAAQKPMVEIYDLIVKFSEAVKSMNRLAILSLWKEKFSFGFQGFRPSRLADLLPDLKRGIKLFEKKYGKKPTWGLDLLTILLAAKDRRNRVDFLFGGTESLPTNRQIEEVVKEQRDQAEKMLYIAAELGCRWGH